MEISNERTVIDFVHATTDCEIEGNFTVRDDGKMRIEAAMYKTSDRSYVGNSVYEDYNGVQKSHNVNDLTLEIQFVEGIQAVVAYVQQNYPTSQPQA